MSRTKGLCRFAAAGAVGMSVSGVANAQTTCSRPIGPCIIVGDITGPSNYTAGTAPATGGIPVDAFSLGTYSCNPGNVWVNWFQSTTQHPVVGQNMFKLKTIASGSGSYTTFDQIGQSWLKHTFFALSNNLCCTNCQATDGTHLGISCSDPYTSGRNGSQGGLGPKWQVNAHTGAFTYPFASPAMTSSASVARRLIVPLTDLEPTSTTVKYVVDCQYVSPDCATAGNQNYATSYRTATVSGGPADFNMALTASTVREQPAVYYWLAQDPTITLRALDVTTVPPAVGTERFFVCSKASDLGNGMWHYEFAVYNQNSDQCAGKFTVPLADGAIASNIAFHCVQYFDGDGNNNVNFANAAWTSTRANNQISWATTPFATNSNGNAIRWGTMYSFRFDANVPPNLAGAATVTTWKNVADFQAGAQVPSGAIAGQCYANCDLSVTTPYLNVADFVCFLGKFAAGDSYANCDASTVPPVLNIGDFTCFMSQFSAGCSAP